VLAGGARPGPDPGQHASRDQEEAGQSQPSGEPPGPAHGTDQEVLQVTVGFLGPHRGDLAGRDQRDQEREGSGTSDRDRPIAWRIPCKPAAALADDWAVVPMSTAKAATEPVMSIIAWIVLGQARA